MSALRNGEVVHIWLGNGTLKFHSTLVRHIKWSQYIMFTYSSSASYARGASFASSCLSSQQGVYLNHLQGSSHLLSIMGNLPPTPIFKFYFVFLSLPS